MDIFLDKIHIKSLCNIIQEYCHYPRPYLNELDDVTSNIKQKIDTFINRDDMGYTALLYIKQGYIEIDSHSALKSSDGKFRLLDRENERRRALGLKVNNYIFGCQSCSATNECYIGY